MNINTFSELSEVFKKSGSYSIEDINLSKESIDSLCLEINASWKSFQECAESVLSNYYNIKVSTDIIKTVLLEDIDLAFEVYSGGVSDTCQRSILLNSILKKLGIRAWPTYGEGDKIFGEFIETLQNHPQITILD